MNADHGDTIDLRRLVNVPNDETVHVTRRQLHEALEANRAPGSKRRLSSQAHIELTLRHKAGEPAAQLARAYGISPGSVAQVVHRVERAAKRILTSNPRKTAKTTAEPDRPRGEDASVNEAVKDDPKANAASEAASAPKRGGAPDNETAAGIATGPFLRETLDAIRPLVEPSQVSGADLRRVATNLERIANLMHRRADQDQG